MAFRPVSLYRFTQGLHVATGIAAAPLLLAKLWTVYPRLFIWPPVQSAAHALERLSLLPLVGGAVFLLVSGLNNIALRGSHPAPVPGHGGCRQRGGHTGLWVPG